MLQLYLYGDWELGLARRARRVLPYILQETQYVQETQAVCKYVVSETETNTVTA